MRIIIPSFEEIKLMPPTITLFKILAEMGHEVYYITIFPDEFYENFNNSNIINVPLYKKNFLISHKYNIPNIIGIRGIFYRIDVLLKKIFAKKLGKILNKLITDRDLLWIVNEMTPIIAGSSFIKKYENKYIFTIYELHYNKLSNKNIKKTAQKAKFCIVPEYNRAHMQQYFFNLNHTPYILPNKPLVEHIEVNLPEELAPIIKKVKDLKDSGKKLILYMGIIGTERPLENIIEAIKNKRDEFELIILGRSSVYLDFLQKKYSDNFTYLGWTKPPYHLEIAKLCDIGLVLYVPQKKMGLNALYCAPNKIYEYTGLGKPVLANSIPGLYNIIDKYECGLCCNLDNKIDIFNKIENISKNYIFYAKGAKSFYDSVNIKECIKEIIEKAK